MSVTPLLSSLLIHPERVSADALAAYSPGALVDAAHREQIVPQAVTGLERTAPGSAHLEAMREAARQWTLYEAIERRAVVEVLDAAAVARMLFFKGASLAYSTYPAPFARMRQDWDVFVAAEDLGQVEGALRQCGFSRMVQTPGRIRVRQQSYRRNLGEGECTIDLHAALFNPPGMASRIGFESIDAAAIPLPMLHAAARGTSEIDALVIACLHRLVHHSADPRLVWDYDLHLLTHRLSGMFDTVMARAAEWGAEGLVAAEIRRVGLRFDAPLPSKVLERIERVAPPRDPFAREGRSRAHEFLIDWRGLGWRQRLALARDTFLPDPAFVRASTGSTMPLPWLYLRRLVKGAAWWFRPVRRRED